MKEQHGCGKALESPPCYGVTPTAEAEINRQCLFVKSMTLLPSTLGHVHRAVTHKNILNNNPKRQCNFTVFKWLVFISNLLFFMVISATASAQSTLLELRRRSPGPLWGLECGEQVGGLHKALTSAFDGGGGDRGKEEVNLIAWLEELLLKLRKGWWCKSFRRYFFFSYFSYFSIGYTVKTFGKTVWFQYVESTQKSSWQNPPSSKESCLVGGSWCLISYPKHQVKADQSKSN